MSDGRTVSLQGVSGAPRQARSTQPMLITAMQLLDAFTTEQRQQAQLPFESDDRDNWDFLPASGRLGLPLRAMTHGQQLLVHRLVGSLLAPEAYARVVTTMGQEHVLRELEAPLMGPSAVEFRDPGGYFFSFFGKPDLEQTWSWRLVGHHLSLNVTVVRQEFVSVTPMLIGSQPGRFGPTRHLGEEEDLGFALLEGLSPSQREQVVIHPVSPVDLVTKSVRRIGDVEYPGYFTVGRHHLQISDEDRKALVYMREHPRGIAYGSLDDGGRAQLRALLECYVERVKPDQAAFQMDRITKAGVDGLHFAWSGATSYDGGHYYRIQGPVTVIEFDNTEDGANHIHAVWRDPDGDFGRDLLLEHVAAEHQGYDQGHVHDWRVEQVPPAIRRHHAPRT
jgi:hypothetical protein